MCLCIDVCGGMDDMYMSQRQTLQEALCRITRCTVLSFTRLGGICTVAAFYSNEFMMTPLSIWLLVWLITDVVLIPFCVRDIIVWRRMIRLQTEYDSDDSRWVLFQHRLYCYKCEEKLEVIWYVAGIPWWLCRMQDRVVTPACYWLTVAFLIPIMFTAVCILLVITLAVLSVSFGVLIRSIVQDEHYPIIHNRRGQTGAVVVTIDTGRLPSVTTNRYTVTTNDTVPVGLAKEALQQLHTYTFSSSLEKPLGECPICFDTLTTGDIGFRLTCQHMFHRDCLETWLLRTATCPLCKTEVRAYPPVP